MPATLHYHRQSLNPDCTIIVFFWCGLIGRWTPVLPLCLATHCAEYLQSLSAPPATDGLVMLPLVLWSRPTTTNPTNSCLKISATNYETARLLSTRLCSFSVRVLKSEMKGLFCCKKLRVEKKWKNSVTLKSIYVTMCVKGQLSNLFFSLAYLVKWYSKKGERASL